MDNRAIFISIVLLSDYRQTNFKRSALREPTANEKIFCFVLFKQSRPVRRFFENILIQ